jgi:hypothetical protein
MQQLKNLPWLFALVTLSACGAKSTELVWYEEAMQDDGSIVIVKKIESGYSASRKEPGANNYGYRSPKVELTDPKTGKRVTWYPRGLPLLLPYALHFDGGVPYMFATAYLFPDYSAFGCPRPPYIVFRWDGDRWKRIPLSALPRPFKRHNLLSSAGQHLYDSETETWSCISPGRVVKAETIAKAVGANRRESAKLEPYEMYAREIQYADVGPPDSCSSFNGVTKYENVEIK